MIIIIQDLFHFKLSYAIKITYIITVLLLLRKQKHINSKTFSNKGTDIDFHKKHVYAIYCVIYYIKNLLL